MMFVNAFPKAGLHLALAMGYAARQERRDRGWACSFDGGPWTADPLPVAEVLHAVQRLRPGALLRGHVGYYPEVMAWLAGQGVAVFFVYRDLRDARAMPRFYRRRAMRIDTLRDLYSGECRLYAGQRARADAQAAMNGFINSLAAE